MASVMWKSLIDFQICFLNWSCNHYKAISDLTPEIRQLLVFQPLHSISITTSIEITYIQANTKTQLECGDFPLPQIKLSLKSHRLIRKHAKSINCSTHKNQRFNFILVHRNAPTLRIHFEHCLWVNKAQVKFINACGRLCPLNVFFCFLFLLAEFVFTMNFNRKKKPNRLPEPNVSSCFRYFVNCILCEVILV